ncbi:MAG: Major Facilitator Superfamily protein [Promethearchaeota archaeon]|nr:MAG: Major Facilitator Superfamily protein [Candidatus Lokiarchaeota archaeon]
MNGIKFLNEDSPIIKRYIYGLPRLGTATLLGIENWALFTLYTSGYGLDSFRVGIALAIGYITIAISQFLLGWISDQRYTKFGRRKPYILVFAPLLGFSIIFLLFPTNFLSDITNKNLLFIWLLLWDVVFRASFAVTTPYQALMAEIFSAEERPKVSQIENSYNYIGNAIMVIFILLILTDYIGNLQFDAFQLGILQFNPLQFNPLQFNTLPLNIQSSVPLTYTLPIAFFGVLTFILFYIVVIFLPTEPYYEMETTMKENLKTILQNKNFLSVVVMLGFAGFGLTIITNTMLKYVEDALYLRGADYMVISIFLLLSIFLFLHIWRVLIDKIGKKNTLLYVFLFGALFLPITLLAVFPMGHYIFLGIILVLGIAALIAGWNLFPYIVYADIAEEDRKETGTLKPGIYAGFPSMILNLFQALSVFFIGIVLSIPIYYNSNNSIGLLLWGPITSVVFILSYVYTKKYVKLDFELEV